MNPEVAEDKPSASSRSTRSKAAFETEMLTFGSQTLRVGRMPAKGGRPPLMLFNGIGGNIELLEPLAQALTGREVLIFDIPGVGQSPMPRRPYRLPDIAKYATAILDHYEHAQADVLGVSWGGAAAQQFVRTAPDRCRRLILCATATGAIMLPARPGVLWKMATPRRYISRDYSKAIAGDIYGGDLRGNSAAAADFHKNVKWQSSLGYYLQLAAVAGWTSVHWLHRVKQPTLIMAGEDDPLIPLANPKLMHKLIDNSELKLMDCGHLFLLTRTKQASEIIREFLDRP